MKKIAFILNLALILIASSCEKEKDKDPNFFKELISGYVQKGPYINGTSITISELSDELIPTGKNFNSQILDNKGTFELRNIDLSSEFVELKADGFYFNEIKNESSNAQLTLFALSDLTDKTSININVLSNLEKSRVEYLISNGTTFDNAKKQAQSEILQIFRINKPDIPESEILDISKSGEDNSILLAASVILQGYMSVAELSELLANISTDMREDGILNSQTLGSTLINNAKTIKLDLIRENLEKRYETLGLEVSIPNFEKYVNQFIDNTDFEFTGGIKYPAIGKHGLNILDKEKTEYTTGTYSMNATLPEGTSLKVKIKGEFHWYFSAFQTNTGWEKSSWNDIDSSRTFTSIRTGDIDFEMMLESFEADSIHGDSTITYTNMIDILVYENGAFDPTWTKVITINE